MSIGRTFSGNHSEANPGRKRTPHPPEVHSWLGLLPQSYGYAASQPHKNVPIRSVKGRQCSPLEQPVLTVSRYAWENMNACLEFRKAEYDRLAGRTRG